MGKAATTQSTAKKRTSPKGSTARTKPAASSGHPEITIAIVGFFLSITLYELLHLVLHWHQITGIRFFPNFYTIAELIVKIPETYDLASEEFIAYAISASTLLITAGIIAKVHDSNDTRTVNQILFPELYRAKGRAKK